ncbi:MAG: DUF4097 family beta strand repeat-containing protein [Rhodanobacteraceae bacterium]
MKNVLLLSLALTGLCLSSATWADTNVTRTLTESPAVAAGTRISVENLVGHMTVTQGPSFQVTATVVAGGSKAQALAQSVKLDVDTSGKQVTVHVHYPVDQYDSYRYVTHDDHDKVCVLGIVCFHGSGSSSMEYQGRQVRVYRGEDEGVPLHVDVAVRIPAGMQAKLVNEAGVLEANGLANRLALDTSGGDVYAGKLSGDLTAGTDGGDLHVQELKGNLQAATDGGDLYLSQATGDVHLDSDGGDGHISHATGSLDAHTGGGDLYVTDYTSGSNVSLHTGGGDLDLVGDLATAHNLEVDTGGGDADLKTSNLSLHLDASSGGGDISVRLPNATKVDSSDYHYSADIGKAQGQGSISSGGGDINVSG